MNTIAAVTSFVCFWVVYWCIPGTWTPVDKNRATSFAHCLFAGGLALYLAPGYYQPLVDMHASVLWRPGSILETAFLSISLGYLVYDLLLGVLIEGVNPPEIVGHHVASIALIASSFSHGGVPLGCLMMLHELSVPYTNINGCLSKESPLRIPNGFMMAFSFFFCRLVVVALVLRVMHFAPDIGRVKEHMPVALTLQMLGVAVLGALDAWWFYLICKKIMKAVSASSRKQ